MNWPKTHYIIIALIAASSFTLGWNMGKMDCEVCPPQNVNLSLFWETWRVLEENFVDKSKIDYQKMIYGAVSGMVKSVGDPYTVFFNPSETKKFIEDASGSFEGVGMEIGMRQEQLQVITPLEGTPAKKAGLRAGDLIIKIDDKTTTGMSIDEAIDLIRGPKGSKVTLTVYREEWHETREIELTRDVIQIPSLKWQMLDGDIAYIQLYQFSEKATNDFKKAGLEILGSNAKKIVLDLRNNPGGYLNVAQDIAGWFLKKGEVVVIEDFGSDQEKEEYKSQGPSLFEDYPVVILINQGSASASEILAGALRDIRDVKIVGEKSFGKGSVQQLESLSNGSSLKVTTAKWLTPNGNQISEKGLLPDAEIKRTYEDEQAGKDPQLDKAIELIREIR